jgi:hypothetical protein
LCAPWRFEFDFDVIRADEIAKPGMISNQTIEHIINDNLVIADLTGRNPNVYYELAVRHATRNPVIQLLEKGEELPFDVAGTRTIIIDHQDLDSADSARKTLREYINNVLNDPPGGADSPISLAFDLKALRESQDPQRASLANIAERMTDVHGTILSIQNNIESRFSKRLDQILTLLSTKDDRNVKSSDAVSDLSQSIDGLRSRLLKAIDGMIDEIKEEHTQLAGKIQAVFDRQATETAADVVSAGFSKVVDKMVENGEIRRRLLNELMETFMFGMRSMGQYQHINITQQTHASTEKIKIQIESSIKDVFHGIDDIENKIIALPNLSK